MNAIQFIKDHGVDKAREVVEGAPEHSFCYDLDRQNHVAYEDTSIAMCFLKSRFIDLSELKGLVESVAIVEKLEGIEAAKSYVPDRYKSDRLKQAIADYEAIYTNDIKIEVSFGVSLMSPERVACIDLTSASPTSDTSYNSDLEYHVSKNCKVIDYD